MEGLIRGPVIEKVIEMRSAGGMVDLSGNAEGFLFPADLRSIELRPEVNKINLSKCSLIGGIPPFFGKISSATELDLSHNSLSGSIPAYLSKLLKLQILRLNNNQLSGHIPAELSALSEMQHFFAQCNNLSGDIPASFNDFKAIHTVSLNNNSFDGLLHLEIIALIFRYY